MGATWVTRWSDEQVALTTVAWPSARTVIALGTRADPARDRPVVVTSRDGGATWTERPAVIPAEAAEYWRAFEGRFVSDRVGVLFQRNQWAYPFASGIVLRTGDGGRTWTRMSFQGRRRRWSPRRGDRARGSVRHDVRERGVADGRWWWHVEAAAGIVLDVRAARSRRR